MKKLSKEPNGTLVMTTCKCRENNLNLVMTRTWFEEQLENKVALGVKQERERIIELLEKWGEDNDRCYCCNNDVAAFDLTELIEGKENDRSN